MNENEHDMLEAGTLLDEAGIRYRIGSSTLLAILLEKRLFPYDRELDFDYLPQEALSRLDTHPTLLRKTATNEGNGFYYIKMANKSVLTLCPVGVYKTWAFTNPILNHFIVFPRHHIDTEDTVSYLGRLWPTYSHAREWLLSYYTTLEKQPDWHWKKSPLLVETGDIRRYVDDR